MRSSSYRVSTTIPSLPSCHLCRNWHRFNFETDTLTLNPVLAPLQGVHARGRSTSPAYNAGRRAEFIQGRAEFGFHERSCDSVDHIAMFCVGFSSLQGMCLMLGLDTCWPYHVVTVVMGFLEVSCLLLGLRLRGAMVGRSSGFSRNVGVGWLVG